MIPEAQKQQMAEAVAKIRETMAAAAKAAGRDPAEVRLCAACKTRTVEEVRYSADLPIDLFGENHVQELVEKTDANAYNGKPGHFIGHLQTNKVNKVVGRAALIQSVDSTRLLDKIDAAAAVWGWCRTFSSRSTSARRPARAAWTPTACSRFWSCRRQRAHPSARPDGDPARRRRRHRDPPLFAQMRELLARADARHYDRAQMDILSMGMSTTTPLPSPRARPSSASARRFTAHGITAKRHNFRLPPRGKLSAKRLMRAKLPQRPVHGISPQTRPSSGPSGHLPPRGKAFLFSPPVFPRRHPVPLFEQTVEVGQILKPALLRNRKHGIAAAAQASAAAFRRCSFRYSVKPGRSFS